MDSRGAEDGASVRRRRECVSCARRFTTYERLDELPLIVVKKDGRREPFSRTKLLGGLVRACEKRPIPIQALESLVDDVEKHLRNEMEREVQSAEIGEMVIHRLRQLDGVAYVRFASVYREFKDVSTFMEEIEKLLKRDGGRD